MVFSAEPRDWGQQLGSKCRPWGSEGLVTRAQIAAFARYISRSPIQYTCFGSRTYLGVLGGFQTKGIQKKKKIYFMGSHLILQMQMLQHEMGLNIAAVEAADSLPNLASKNS